MSKRTSSELALSSEQALSPEQVPSPEQASDEKPRRPWWRRIVPPAALVTLGLAVGVTAVVTLVHDTEHLLDASLGLLGTLLALVYEMHHRIGHRIRATDRRALLLAPADAVPGLFDDLLDIATSARNTLIGSKKNDRLFKELMDEKLGETKVYMHDLARGHIRVLAGADTPMSNQIDVVQRSVKATTIAEVDTEWWGSPDGHAYLERNRDAIARGVETKRIVLWEKRDVSTERKGKALAQVVREQRDAGVFLRFIDRSTIDEQQLLTNMAIYDESSYNDVAFNVNGKDIWVDYYFDPNDAKQAGGRFNRLWRSAKDEIPPEIKKHLPPDESTDTADTSSDPSANGDGMTQPPADMRERLVSSPDGNGHVPSSGVEGAGQSDPRDDDEAPASPPDPAPQG